MPHKEIKYNITGRGCWECHSHKPDKSGKGYPNVRVGGKTIPVHRYMYTIHVGVIPDGKIIRHKCDNRICCNPLHLEPGTQADNVRDRFERGRCAKGAANSATKLNEDAVRAIRLSNKRVASIARDYGVNRRAIEKILNGITWKHVK